MNQQLPALLLSKKMHHESAEASSGSYDAVLTHAESRPRAASARARTCTKCIKAMAQVSLGGDSRCSACFVASVQTKFLSLIKVQHAVSHGDLVAVAVSGSAASMVLLHLLAQVCSLGWNRPERGKVRERLRWCLMLGSKQWPCPLCENLPAGCGERLCADTMWLSCTLMQVACSR
jgi:hypothetical protein